MTAKELIKEYKLMVNKEGRLYSRQAEIDRSKKDNRFDEIVEKKDEIITYIKSEEEKEKLAMLERSAKIDAIEGLKEIELLKEDWYAYDQDFKASFESEDRLAGRTDVKKPDVEIGTLLKKYPRAAAYLRAQAFSFAANYAKASAGDKALERIINGEDYNKVIAEMENEWNAYVEERRWD